MFHRLVLALAAIAALCTHATAQPVADVTDFASNEEFRMARLSPDGERLAFLTTVDGGDQLVVVDLVTGARQEAGAAAWRTMELLWTSDSVIALRAIFPIDIRGYGEGDVSGVVSFDLDNDLDVAFTLQPTVYTPDAGNIVGIEAGTGYMIAPKRTDGGQIQLRAVNPLTRAFRVLALGSDETRHWIVDADGRFAGNVEYSNRHNRLRIRRNDGEPNWPIVREINDTALPDLVVYGLTGDGEMAFVSRYIDPRTQGRTALLAMSMESGEITRILSMHPDLDISEVIGDPYSNTAVGVRYETNLSSSDWLDASLAALESEARTAIGAPHAVLESWSRDRTTLLLRVRSMSAPDRLVLYNAASSEVRELGSARPRLAGRDLPARQPYAIRARDGVDIPGFLTVPQTEGPYPTVILVHDGPGGRTRGGFDNLAHLLAIRGYAVYEPNFRGSTGFGHDWAVAGFGGWGLGVMQTDLTDSLRALEAADITVAGQACIVGAAYGGYAALAAATFTPDVFTCGAGYSPISELDRYYQRLQDRTSSTSWRLTLLSQRLAGGAGGRPDGAWLDRISPIEHVEAITMPLLLVHSEDDSVNLVEQSRRFTRAARRAGADVTLVEREGTDHYLLVEDARQVWYSELVDFLAAHLPANAPVVAPAD
ncbi:alpha/beta hydrolase family protein [Maricaulis maris]|uniref:Dipeptidyl aminopeptidase/acylaminoacyl peptidase n=1 Tax=Maricaulis maris TaxID=74318 RepID=A0A495DDW1_9PROT|nr:prolyl oligopeptidase family serine peptidase [Maricaulis maris]RKR00095.1 dipeptidyl aminopeptidase/acylaminoacyl peptidase [Maricaulis maris]